MEHPIRDPDWVAAAKRTAAAVKPIIDAVIKANYRDNWRDGECGRPAFAMVAAAAVLAAYCREAASDTELPLEQNMMLAMRALGLMLDFECIVDSGNLQ